MLMQRVADLAARPSHTANEPHPDHVPLNDIKNHLHIPTRRRRPALGMHTFGRLIAADANSSTPTATTGARAGEGTEVLARGMGWAEFGETKELPEGRPLQRRVRPLPYDAVRRVVAAHSGFEQRA